MPENQVFGQAGGGISPKVIPMPVFFDNYYNDDKEAA